MQYIYTNGVSLVLQNDFLFPRLKLLNCLGVVYSRLQTEIAKRETGQCAIKMDCHASAKSDSGHYAHCVLS